MFNCNRATHEHWNEPEQLRRITFTINQWDVQYYTNIHMSNNGTDGNIGLYNVQDYNTRFDTKHQMKHVIWVNKLFNLVEIEGKNATENMGKWYVTEYVESNWNWIGVHDPMIVLCERVSEMNQCSCSPSGLWWEQCSPFLRVEASPY